MCYSLMTPDNRFVEAFTTTILCSRTSLKNILFSLFNNTGDAVKYFGYYKFVSWFNMKSVLIALAFE